MLARLRPLYIQLVLPLGKLSVKLGFTPDFWTLFGLVLGIISGVFLALGEFWLGLLFAFLMFFADVLDGSTARAGGTSSSFGTVLDHVIDRYAEFAVIFGLMFGRWITPEAALFCATGMIMASYVRAKAESSGGIRDCVVGFAGRAEKLTLIYIAIVFLGLGIGIVSEYIFWIVGVVSHLTAIQRLLFARKAVVLSEEIQ